MKNKRRPIKKDSKLTGCRTGSAAVLRCCLSAIFVLLFFTRSSAQDCNRNWVLTRTYDENGNEISSTKAFFDNNGKATQTQTKNETTGQVLATQVIYDLQGRGALSTLAAPINNTSFAYNSNFVTSSATGAAYDYTSFDWNSTLNYGKTNSPDVVGSTLQGSLGWYYSSSNTLEPMVAATGYPYTRTDFYHDGTGAAKRDAGIGETLRMGMGHETTGNSFPVQNELNNYLAIRNQFFPAATVGGSPTTMAGQALQSVSTDQNGTSVLSVTDLSGKQTLMTARADATTGAWLPVKNTLSLGNVLPQYVFNITTATFTGASSGPPGNGGLRVPNYDGFSISSANNVIVYQDGTPVYNGPGNNYVYTGNGTLVTNVYQVTSASPFTVSAADQIGGYVFYDQAEAVYQEPPATAIQYFQLATPFTVSITGSYTLYSMTSETAVAGFISGSTVLPAGYYKIIATVPATATPNNVTVSYTNGYSDISYNYYNQLGQLIASIAPNGVQQLIKNGYSAYTTAAQLPFVTTYQYDLQGRLISTTSPDANSPAVAGTPTSSFVYRQDGKIRFSQNAFQANAANAGTGKVERFSYTNYDSFGRPIESGEYAASAATFAGLSANTTLLEATGTASNVANCTKLASINTYYDVPAANLSLTGYVQDPGFLKGAVSYTTNTVNGTVNSTTWYNYDDHGRVSWMVKQIPGLTTPTTYKTVNYTYNAQGNVTQVSYQQGAADQFIHYYAYDQDGRLMNVQTSTDGIHMAQQANYYYYLHGPLKRTELGNQVQGLDYVYTPQGWLKAINTPTGIPANDPGQDGAGNSFAPDAFGMQLEYFPGDYSRTGSNVTGITTGTQNYYNGNVTGISWHSNTPSSGPNPPAMYSYTYDAKYQYTGATWGTPSFTPNSGTFTPSANNIFNEKTTGSNYDANGNITGLQRTGVNGGSPVDIFSYNYTTNTNKLASVASTGTSTGGQPYGTYTYDELGRLKTSVTIPVINSTATVSYYLQYDVTGKVTGIYSSSAMTPASLVESYAYDESGNRIKTVNSAGIATYYVYDAAGNVMAIYTQTGTATPVLTEVPVYGSSRLGTYFAAGGSYVYELRDNVGSVRVAVMGTKNSTTGQANIYNYSDYFPYGSVARQAITGTYRYAYQGAYAESDQSTGYNDFKLRMYDGRLGRWLSVDPEGQFASPYEGMGNDPVMGSDPTGGYDTWLGAWIASFFGLKGDVLQDHSGGLNDGQWFYSHQTPTADGFGVSASREYGSGSQVYQLYQYMGRQNDQLQREIEFDKHPSQMGELNPYTGKVNGSGALTEVYPVEAAIFLIPSAGESIGAEALTGKYAFGLKNVVPEFAEEINAIHLMKDPNWQTSFMKIIANPENDLHFTLDGIDEAPMKMILDPNRSGINWELHTLYNSPAFENTTFYFGGDTFTGFDVFKVKP